ncbi:MAG: hypothetical protein ICV57_05930, partial [Rubrobacter sp.]|nr:hypothetical protein [Rubrobacter sp.]
RYALDAEVTGDERLANVFPKVQKMHAGVAGQAEGCSASRTPSHD